MPLEEKMAKGNRMCEHETLEPVQCSGEEWRSEENACEIMVRRYLTILFALNTLQTYWSPNIFQID